MKDFIKFLVNQSNRKVTFTFLAISIISSVIAFIIGISDNPPGILLLFIGFAALILVFVHHWRKAKKFLILFIASLIGFPIFVILHNVMYALEEMVGDIVVISQLIRFIDISSFFIAILVCPAGVLVGAVGSIVFFLKNKMTK